MDLVPTPWSPPSPLPGPIQTQRFLLRDYEADDAASLFAAIQQSRESMLPWLPWAAREHRTIHETIYAIEQFRRAREDLLRPEHNQIYGRVLGIFERGDDGVMGGVGQMTGKTGALVGGLGLARLIPATHTGEIGYWCRTDRRNRGIATEATAHLISQALTPQSAGGWGLRRVVIYCATGNAASRRVPEKLGLRLELQSRDDRVTPGIGIHGSFGWGVLAEEWDSSEHRRR